MKHGVYPVKLLRLFRYGAARCEQRHMDEHMELSRGRAVEFEHDFVDENLNGLGWWAHKHVDYSARELADLEDILSSAAADSGINGQAERKRAMKERYARQPLFWRSFAYFCYRYFLKLGFLDGREGFCGISCRVGGTGPSWTPGNLRNRKKAPARRRANPHFFPLFHESLLFHHHSRLPFRPLSPGLPGFRQEPGHDGLGMHLHQ